jgi:hypothetical protein
MNNLETCLNCESIYIQFDNFTDECYCLIKSCGHHWFQHLIRDEIKNDYLRISMHKERV